MTYGTGEEWGKSFIDRGLEVPPMPTVSVSVVETITEFNQAKLNAIVGSATTEFVSLAPKEVVFPPMKAPVDLFPITMVPLDVRDPTAIIEYNGGGASGLPWTAAPASITTVMPLIGTMLIYLGREVAAQLAISGVNELVQRAKKKYNIRGIKFRYLTGASVSYTDRGRIKARNRMTAVPERIPDKGHMPTWDEFPWWMKPF